MFRTPVASIGAQSIHVTLRSDIASGLEKYDAPQTPRSPIVNRLCTPFRLATPELKTAVINPHAPQFNGATTPTA